LIAFLAQLNPLFGPEVKNALAAHMRKAWLGFNTTSNKLYPCKEAVQFFTILMSCSSSLLMQVIQTGDVANVNMQ
jgi:hypothetical protein